MSCFGRDLSFKVIENVSGQKKKKNQTRRAFFRQVFRLFVFVFLFLVLMFLQLMSLVPILNIANFY